MSPTLEQSSEKLLHLMDKIRRLDAGTAPPIEANISTSQLSVINFMANTPGCGVQALANGLKLSTRCFLVGVSVCCFNKWNFVESPMHAPVFISKTSFPQLWIVFSIFVISA